MKKCFTFSSFYENIPKLDLKMRLTILLLSISLFNGYANGYSQKISLNLNDVELRTALDLIEDNSEFRFLYQENDINLGLRVSLNVKSVGIEKILSLLFTNTSIKHQILDKQIILALKNNLKPLAQNTMLVEGVVTDEAGLPIPGITVIYKEYPNKGTSTDIDGKYQILVNKDQTATLQFSSIGYETQEVDVNGRATINVTMKESSNQLNEVVVVGYGTTKRKDLTGSIGTIKAKDLVTNSTAASFDQLLGGKVSGVLSTQNSGEPGSGAFINIRGLSTVRGDNQPLYIIDGVPIYPRDNVPTSFAAGNGGFIQANPLAAINPNDIESVDILKDASSAAIYGSRAANGVVIITTKRGRKGKDQLDINAGYVLSSQSAVKTFDLMNASEYRAYMERIANQTVAAFAAGNTSANVTFANQILNNQRVDVFGRNHGVYFFDSNTDWQKELTRSSPITNTFNVNVTGSSEKSAYSLGANTTKQEGLFKENDFKRHGLRTSLDFSPNDKLTLGGTINYAYSLGRDTLLNNYRSAIFNPTAGVNDVVISQFGRPADPGVQNAIVNSTRNSSILANVYASLEVFKNLTFKTDLGIHLTDNERNNFSPQAAGIIRKGKVDSNTDNTTWTNTLTYRNTLAEAHTLEALAGITWDKRNIKQVGVGFIGFPNDRISPFPGNNVDNFATYENVQETFLNSYLARVAYNYKQKYYLTLTGRFDGSDKFTPNNRWAFFPAVSGSWKISNESFLEDSNIIDDLTLKGGFGKTGNNALQSFSFTPTYTVNNSAFGGSTVYNGTSGLTSPLFANNTILWEATDQIDASLSFSLLNSRLTGSVGYFLKNSKDVIGFSIVAPQTGYRSQVGNTTEIENKGWEVELGGDIFRTKDFTWSSAFNITFIDNKLVSLGGSTPFEGFTNAAYREGQPLGAITGYLVDGLFTTQAEVDAANAGAGGQYSSNARVGNYRYRDVSGPNGVPDGKITTDDITVLGNIQPDYYGGWTNTLTYKGFNLYFDFQFSQGAKKEWGFQSFAARNYGDYDRNNLRGILDNTYSADNPNAMFPTAIFGTTDQESGQFNTTISTRIYDASFLRLKTIRIGYDLSKELLGKLPFKSVNFSLSANNIVTWTKWPGLDPESSGNSRDVATLTRTLNVYPLMRTITFGINVGL